MTRAPSFLRNGSLSRMQSVAEEMKRVRIFFVDKTIGKPTQNQCHLSAQTIVNVQWISFVDFVLVANVRTDNTPGYNFRHFILLFSISLSSGKWIVLEFVVSTFDFVVAVADYRVFDWTVKATAWHMHRFLATRRRFERMTVRVNRIARHTWEWKCEWNEVQCLLFKSIRLLFHIRYYITTALLSFCFWTILQNSISILLGHCEERY